MIPIVNCIAGSHLYGVNTPDSDMDTMGLGVMTKQEKLGLHHVEQQGQDDHVVYELSKWVRLALNGNPTVLQLLFTHQSDHIVYAHPKWATWQQELRELVLTERCRSAFLGYLDGQRKKLLNNRGQRQELIDKYGYDTKFAMHMLRLAVQGVEVVQHGGMTLPMSGIWQDLLLDVRNGKYSENTVLKMTASMEQVLKTVKSCLPKTHNPVAVDQWLVKTYEEMWLNEPCPNQ